MDMLDLYLESRTRRYLHLAIRSFRGEVPVRVEEEGCVVRIITAAGTRVVAADTKIEALPKALDVMPEIVEDAVWTAPSPP